MSISALLSRAAITATAVLLAACAATGAGSGKASETLEQRAEARWQHLIAKQWEPAYQFLTPGARSATSLATYIEGLDARKINWINASVLSKECAADNRCELKVEVGFELIGGMRGVSRFEAKDIVEESWLRIGGVWYFLPRQPVR